MKAWAQLPSGDNTSSENRIIGLRMLWRCYVNSRAGAEVLPTVGRGTDANHYSRLCLRVYNSGHSGGFRRSFMASACPVDLDTQVLRWEVSRVYSRVATEPGVLS